MGTTRSSLVLQFLLLRCKPLTGPYAEFESKLSAELSPSIQQRPCSPECVGHNKCEREQQGCSKPRDAAAGQESVRRGSEEITVAWSRCCDAGVVSWAM